MKSQKVFDSFLVLQYRSGKKEALELLVKRHHKKLCRHAYWFVHDFDLAKDIVQESWVTIINKIHNLKDPNSFASWAMRIVTRKSLDFVKKGSKKREQMNQYRFDSQVVEIEDDQSEEIKKLKKAIRELSRDKQVVLRLFYTEDYTLQEIAEILEISIGTVKSRLFHAREKLKTILKT